MAFVDMRKVITTQMLKKATTEEKAILHRVLAHSEKTSRDWYTWPDLSAIGVEGANIIQRLLTSSAADEEADKSSPPPSPGKDVAGHSAITEEEEAESNGHDKQAQTCSPPQRTTRSLSKAATCSKSPSKASTLVSGTVPPATYSESPSKASTLGSGIVPPSPAAKSLTEIQKGQINRTFKKEIEKRVNITMEVAQKQMRLNPLLSHLSTSRARVKQVVNYVN